MHHYIDTSTRWAIALRRLMNYPDFRMVVPTIAFTASASVSEGQDQQIAQVAADMGRDIVHVGFDGLDAGAPNAVSLAILRPEWVGWIPNCSLYSASETAPIEILAPSHRWRVGPRNMLTSAKLPPAAKRARGEQIAWRRWRQAVEAMPTPELQGSMFVRPGEQLADALPMEMLDIAA